MANLTNNRISAEVTVAAEQQVKDGIQMIQNALPFLIGLTTAERMNLPKISVSNKVFTEDAINLAVNNGELLPSFIKTDEMSKDINLYHKLDVIAAQLQQLLEKVNDTQMLAGSEAYSAALVVYKVLEAASEAGIEGTKSAYEQLKQRFTQSTSTTTPSTTAE